MKHWERSFDLVEYGQFMPKINVGGMTPGRIRFELDGLRAIAVWIVMLYHAGAPLFSAGWIGVDIFFVLSGFLISTILLNEKSKMGKISIWRFWVRRLLRLVPAYVLYVATITVLFLMSDPSSKLVQGVWTPERYLISLWTYTNNFFPGNGVWSYEYLTRHLWSLCVEQQFYLIFPLALTFGWLLRAPAVITVFGLSGAFILSALTFNISGAEKFSLLIRGNSILVGCAVAAMAHTASERGLVQTDRWTLLHKTVVFLFLAALMGTLLLGEIGRGPDRAALVGLNSLVWVLSAGVIAGFWYGWSNLGSRVLAARPVVFTGKISYGMYLYHMAAWWIVFAIHPWPELLGVQRYLAYGAKLFVYFALTYGFAWLSYRFIEKPFLEMKGSLTPRYSSAS